MHAKIYSCILFSLQIKYLEHSPRLVFFHTASFFSAYIYRVMDLLGPNGPTNTPLVQPTEPGPTEQVQQPPHARPLMGPQNLDPRPFGNCRRLFSPRNLRAIFYPVAPKPICSLMLLAITVISSV
jgi:hypothetical protein